MDDVTPNAKPADDLCHLSFDVAACSCIDYGLAIVAGSGLALAFILPDIGHERAAKALRSQNLRYATLKASRPSG